MSGTGNVDQQVNQVLPGPLNNVQPFESTFYNFGITSAAFQAIKENLKITIDRNMRPSEVRALLQQQLARVNSSNAATGFAATKTRAQPFVFSFQNLSKDFPGPAKFYTNRGKIDSERWVLPVPPADFSVSVPNSQNTVTTISGFTYTHAGNIDLDEVSFEGFFPYVDPAQYGAFSQMPDRGLGGGWTNVWKSSGKTLPSFIPEYISLNNSGAFDYHSPREWVETIVTAMRANQPLIFSVYTPNLASTGAIMANNGVVIEPVAMSVASFSWNMGSQVGGSRRDVSYSITLKRWRRQEICITNYVNQPNTTVGGGAGSGGSGTNANVRKYKVKQGDNLFKIAQKILRNGHRWREIYNLNKPLIDEAFKLYKDANTGKDKNLARFPIVPGLTLKIPKK